MSQQAGPVTRPVAPGSDELRLLIEQIDMGVLERDLNRRGPYAEFELVRQARLGSLRIPRDRGGAGASLRELFETVLAIAEADPDLAHSLRNHFVFSESRLRALATGEDDPWLPRIIEGDIFGQAVTELGITPAGAGSNTPRTTLTPIVDGYRLNGAKFYSTGNLYADWLVVVVFSQEEGGKPTSLIIPADREGVVLEDDWDGIGQRLTGSGTTRFIDVRVKPEELVVGAVTAVGDIPYLATFPQLYLTTVIAGILRRVVRDAVAAVHGRTRAFYHAPDATAAADPIIQQTVGHLAATAYAAEALVLAAASALQASTDAVIAGRFDTELALQASLAAAKAKVVVDEIAQRAASLVFDVGGATAARQSAQLDRHWRNIRTIASHNPASLKAKWIGDYEVNGTPLPGRGFF
jgi:alkylation response protein AidB-like acyl-CoA dehydrogenase